MEQAIKLCFSASSSTKWGLRVHAFYSYLVNAYFIPGAENVGENKETIMPELYLQGVGGKEENEQIHK